MAAVGAESMGTGLPTPPGPRVDHRLGHWLNTEVKCETGGVQYRGFNAGQVNQVHCLCVSYLQIVVLSVAHQKQHLVVRHNCAS